ncbi:MAG: hypothetical protein ACF787_09300 [Rhodopirellula sp. JB053]
MNNTKNVVFIGRVVKEKQLFLFYLDMFLADQAEKAIKQVEDTVEELLGDKFEQEKAEELSGLMTKGIWTHDHPITIDDLRTVEYPADDNIPGMFLNLMALYPQPTKTTPSVEYIPENRREMTFR